jgi:hypothetical protein
MLLEHSDDEAERNLMPVTESLLRKTAMLMRSPPPTFPCEPATPFTPRPLSRRARGKSGPTIRHLLAAVAHFGLAGRSA